MSIKAEDTNLGSTDQDGFYIKVPAYFYPVDGKIYENADGSISAMEKFFLLMAPNLYDNTSRQISSTDIVLHGRYLLPGLLHNCPILGVGVYQ